MKLNWKDIAGCRSTSCSLLFILWIITVLLMVSSSILNSVALRYLREEVEELRRRQNTHQLPLQLQQSGSTKTPETSSNEASQSQSIWQATPHDVAPVSPYPLHPSHREAHTRPCVLEPRKSIVAEWIESQDATSPCMRRNTIELLASWVESGLHAKKACNRSEQKQDSHGDHSNAEAEYGSKKNPPEGDFRGDTVDHGVFLIFQTNAQVLPLAAKGESNE